MKINILYSYHKIFYEWAYVTCYSLRKLGIESDIFCIVDGEYSDISESMNVYPEADFYIVINPSNIPISKIPNNVGKIVWFTEQVDLDSKDKHILEKINHVINYYDFFDLHIGFNRMFSQECSKLGYEMEDTFCYGYEEILIAQYPPCPMSEKNIDIYFEGSNINDRRNEIIKNIPVTVTRLGDFMEKYKENMAKSKIALNIHAYDSNKSFEFPRIMSAIYGKAMVISEYMADCSPFTKDVHLVMGNRDEIPSICEYYISNPKEIATIANNAFDFISTQYRMDSILTEFIKKYIKNDFSPQFIVPENPKVRFLK